MWPNWPSRKRPLATDSNGSIPAISATTARRDCRTGFARDGGDAIVSEAIAAIASNSRRLLPYASRLFTLTAPPDHGWW